MIRFGCLDFGSEERSAIRELISVDNPQLTMGDFVHQFERSFAKWLDVKYSVMVNSGTSALIAAIKALQINKVIHEYSENLHSSYIHTTALTYCADWNALDACNQAYVPRDVGNDFVMHLDMSYDPAADSMRDFLTVDLLGKPCRLNGIIDDASEAVGSKLQGKRMGSDSLLGTFSFYVAHIINTIEGGMVVTNDSELYETLLSIRDNGRICTCPVCSLKTVGACSKRQNSQAIERRWEHQYAGYNFKPTEIQGVLGLCKMDKIDDICNRRHEIYKRYFEEFHEMSEESDEYIVPLAYPVKVKDPAKALAFMEKQGIECRGMFPAYDKSYKNAYRISQEYILLPAHQELSCENAEFIIEKVKLCQ